MIAKTRTAGLIICMRCAEHVSGLESPSATADEESQLEDRDSETWTLYFSIDAWRLNNVGVETGSKDMAGTTMTLDEYEKQVISAMRMQREAEMTRLEEYCSALQQELVSLRGDMAGLEAWNVIMVTALVEHGIMVPEHPGTQYLDF